MKNIFKVGDVMHLQHLVVDSDLATFNDEISILFLAHLLLVEKPNGFAVSLSYK